jgi:hypothetical protein
VSEDATFCIHSEHKQSVTTTIEQRRNIGEARERRIGGESLDVVKED